MMTPSQIEVLRALMRLVSGYSVQLRPLTGKSLPTIRTALAEIHRLELAHITGYTVAGRRLVPIYTIGPGQDAPPPPPRHRAPRDGATVFRGPDVGTLDPVTAWAFRSQAH